MMLTVVISFEFNNKQARVFDRSIIVYAPTIEQLFGNGKEWEKQSGNTMGMGISRKIGNGNGKEWELTALEWEAMGT